MSSAEPGDEPMPWWPIWSQSSAEQSALPPDIDGDLTDWTIASIMRTEEEELADLYEMRMQRGWRE